MGVFDTTATTCAGVKQSFSATSGNAFRACHVNIRSLRKNWDQFRVLTSPFPFFYDCFILTEINVNSDCLPQYAIPGYQVFAYTRPVGRGGGIAVFVKNTWAVTEQALPFTQAEVVALRLSTPTFSLTVFSIYRPPCCNGRIFLSELDSALSA